MNIFLQRFFTFRVRVWWGIYISSPGALNNFPSCSPKVHLCTSSCSTRFYSDCMKKEDGFPAEQVIEGCSFICPWKVKKIKRKFAGYMQLHTSILLSGILNKSMANIVVFNYTIQFYLSLRPPVSPLPTSTLSSSQMEILDIWPYPRHILPPVLVCFPCSLPLSSYFPLAFTYWLFHTCSHSCISLNSPLSFFYFLHGCVLDTFFFFSHGMWSLSSQTRDRTHDPCIRREES